MEGKALGAVSSQTAPEAFLADRMLILLILSLPLMKPALDYPVVLSDAVFGALTGAFVIELIRGKRAFRWRPEYWVLIFYVASFLPSLLATPDLVESLFKLMTQVYLILLALLTASLIETEAQLRRAIVAWLGASSITAFLGLACLAIFPFEPNATLINYARFHFGTLQPGNYPRFSLTFLNANMACNYLSISVVLLLGTYHVGLVSNIVFAVLFMAFLTAAIFTISPGLGGIALVVGVWFWLARKQTSPVLAATVLLSGIATAVCFVIAMAITPILHETAPYLLHLPALDLTLAPSARLMLWSSSLAEFGRHPLIGHGIGIDATLVRYMDPSGNLQLQTDAHNIFLNIAAQCGVIGLVGLAMTVWMAIRRTRPIRLGTQLDAIRVALGLSFLGGFVYQGLGGSFEDTRHLWIVLGLLLAASRVPSPNMIAVASTAAASHPESNL